MEAALNTFKAAHENVTDLLIRLELAEREQQINDKFLKINDAALECLADIKVKIKDQELERVELLSKKSLHSKKPASSVRSSSMTSSSSSSNQTAKIKARLDTLNRCQEIERRQDELRLQERELDRLNALEELHGELSAAEAIQKILQESELNDTIILQEATANSSKQTENQRISNSKPVGQPQTDTTARKEIEERDDKDKLKSSNVSGAPTQLMCKNTLILLPLCLNKVYYYANEKTAKTSVGKSPNFHLRFDVNTPTFDQRDIDKSARSTRLTEHHYNSQL